ncbi:cobalamin biosynthesis protein [Smaragdicoccus niigatensis]|uniref:cobalamin biosynthesis protein n=1 Tax=Smaragdicoccus niigatensis TaxID=359359 RepID=UPI00037A9657|nr:cobalamin biosynthesis protein [Smaragdicoccus niigatensis]
MRNPFQRRAAGLVAGYAADLAVGDPQRFHPVAGFGTVAGRLESLTYRDTRGAGLLYAAALITGAALVGSRGKGTVAVAMTTWSAIGGRSLCRTALQLAEHVEAGDLESARDLVPWLCGRDPQSLDEAGLVRAALESVAENTSDATVAPLFWGAVGGSAGIAGYRASNTLDAMVGYRNAKYERFGWASARIDDVLNYVPARLCGALIVATAPVVGGSPRGAIRAWRRDARKHPSPNAGVVESAMAGALGVGLGGTTVYAHGVEQRPSLGDGPAPTVSDLKRAVRLSSAVQAGAVVSSATLAVAIGEFVRRRRRRGRGSR